MGGWMDERMVKSSSTVSLLITSIKTLVFYLICWDFFLLPSGKRKKKLLKMTNISKHGCILWITLKSLGNEIKKKQLRKANWHEGLDHEKIMGELFYVCRCLMHGHQCQWLATILSLQPLRAWEVQDAEETQIHTWTTDVLFRNDVLWFSQMWTFDFA